MSTLLEINGLYTSFGRDETEIKAVREVSLKIEKGETHALVGESGSGKSVTALSVMQLLPYPVAWHGGGSIRFRGDDWSTPWLICRSPCRPLWPASP